MSGNKFDWKKEIKNQLKDNFGSDVTIRFDGDNPTLVFKDGATKKLRNDAIAFVSVLWRDMGGEVVFNPSQARQVQ